MLIGAIGTMIVASLGLLGYLPGLHSLGSVRDDFIPMAPSTAISFILLSTILVARFAPWSRWLPYRVLLIAVVVSVSVFGALEFIGYVCGRDLNFEEKLVPVSGYLNGIPIGLMSPATGFLFLLAGLSILGLLVSRPEQARRVIIGHAAGITGTIVLLSSSVFSLAYLFGTPLLYDASNTIPMALTTALAFFLLGLATVSACGLHVFPLKLIAGASTNATLLRFFLPLIVLSTLLGILAGVGSSFVSGTNPAFVSALLVVLMCILTGILIGTVASRIGNKLDAANRALQASEAKYQDLYENAPDMFVSVDAISGTIVECNETLSRAVGYTKAELIGRPIIDMYHADSQEAAKKAFQSFVTTGQVNEAALALKRKDGTKIEVSLNVSSLRDDQGQVIQSRSVWRDITVHKQAEDELRFKNLILKTQQETSLDGILVVDNDRTMISTNQRFKEIWGLPTEIIASASDERAIEWVANSLLLHPEEFTRKVKQIYKNTKATTHDEISLKDGRLVSRYSAPMLDADKQYFGRVWYFRDITESRLLESQLRNQQKLESVGTLAGGVAHEINNPINGVINYAQLILDESVEDSNAHNYSKEIITETERVATIVRNLLAFSRHDKQAHSPACMSDIIEATLSLVRTIFRHDQILLTVDVPDSLPKLKCRSQQIQQVLMNLLTNARDALNERFEGHDDEKTLSISASLIQRDGRRWIRVLVQDNGAGISLDVMDSILDPFFTTKGRDKGTGLGLSIAHGIVKEHHGELTFDSIPGHGTKVCLELPVDNGSSLSEETRTWVAQGEE
jgi:PAS domain S-box-containing protein